ncbi:MAG: CoA transferase, partial [Proteobacteria bacterium]|nr:CoA transferase [Pseudomonadota bacterium]
MSEQPLAGVTVLDFGQIYNGPYCGFLLAMAGARVIKVESPQGESLLGRSETSSASYAFAMLNANKEA